MLSSFRKKYIGDRAFYSRACALIIPMVLQSLITNFVSLLDNIMVGRMGTFPMSGVSIVNQFLFVFNLTLFGTLSGPSIFGAQFFGKGDHEGHRYTFRFRLLLTFFLIAAGLLLFRFRDEALICLYISSKDSAAAQASVLGYGKEYLSIMLWTLIPFGISQVYATVIRECGETRIPMLASLAAVGLNLFLDYALIFGKFGLPGLGVSGAAIATLIAKIIEAAVMVIWAHSRKDRNRYLVGAFRSFRIPKALAFQMTKKTIPLLFNEFLWSAGMAFIAQCYSVRSLDIVAARNIASTLGNLFNSVHVQMGAGLAIIVGQALGAGKKEEAKQLDDRMIFFSLLVSFSLLLPLFAISGLFPLLYKTEPEIRALAAYFIRIQILALPLLSYCNAAYFTLRSGGRTGITFLFDFGFTWLVMSPLAFVLCHFTTLDIHLVFAIVTLSEAFKMIIGYFMVRSNIWINNLVG